MSQESQLANAVLMVRPVRFQTNPMTAESNRFQGNSDREPAEQNVAAQREFDELAAALRDAGITVLVFEDSRDPHTPDSVFPNNWVSFHADGRAVMYPMEAENRRTERRPDILESLAADHHYNVREIIDLSGHEDNGHFLEGTGSMVLDRHNRIAYVCLSTRTHLEPLCDFAQRLGYETVIFEAVDRDGVPIYHTNVMMNVGEHFAVICDEAIVREEQRAAVIKCLRDTGHDIISLSYDQLQAFAGNMLELRSNDGQRLIAMSKQAYDSLNDDQRALLRENGKVVAADISNIEASAGGSVRCMLAEIHLPTA